MSDVAEPEPGRPPKDNLSKEIEQLLKTDRKRAWTLGEIVPEVDGSRRTVKDRLDELVESGGKVKYEKIGNATAYWAVEPETSGGIDMRMVQAHLRPFGKKAISTGGFAFWVGLFFGLATIAIWTLPLPGIYAIFTGMATGFAFAWFVKNAQFSVRHTDLLDDYNKEDSLGKSDTRREDR